MRYQQIVLLSQYGVAYIAYKCNNMYFVRLGRSALLSTHAQTVDGRDNRESRGRSRKLYCTTFRSKQMRINIFCLFYSK